MRCDDVRTLVGEGAPLDEAVRGHLAACAACGEEFAALRALMSARPEAPAALREKVLASFPARTSPRWTFAARAAALLLLGLTIGFVSGYLVKPARVEIQVVEKDRPVIVEKIVTKEVEAPLSDDFVFNVGVAAGNVYGKLVKVTFEPKTARVEKITVNPLVKAYEQWCPVARELRECAKSRPDLVEYSNTKEEPKPKREY